MTYHTQQRDGVDQQHFLVLFCTDLHLHAFLKHGRKEAHGAWGHYSSGILGDIICAGMLDNMSQSVTTV